MSKATSKDKVENFLRLVKQKAQSKEIFKISDVTAFVGISSNAGTIVRQAEIVRAVKQIRGTGTQYHWLRGEVDDSLVAELMKLLQDYSKQANSKPKVEFIEVEQIPKPEEKAKYIKDGPTESAADIAFQVLLDIRTQLAETDRKVNHLYNSFFA